MKAEVVEDHIEKIQDLQSYKQHDDKISTLLFQTTNKVDTLKTSEEVMGFNDDENVKDLTIQPNTTPSHLILVIKKGLALKVTEICVVSPKKKLESKILVTLVASPKEFSKVESKKSGVFIYAKIQDALPPLRNIQHQIDLSRKTTLLVSISNEVLGFDSIKKLYACDEDFGNIWMELETKQYRGSNGHQILTYLAKSQYYRMASDCWKRTWGDVLVIPLDEGKKGCQMRLNSASIYRFLGVYGVTDS
ncbi:hypothetical protein Tco_0852118 [Tanacetum coccineum]